MRLFLTALLGCCVAASLCPAIELKPETSKAFDRYVQLTEVELEHRSAPGNFLWLDKHPEDKSRVWLGQPFIVAHQTLEKGQEIAVPDGLIQDWVGAIYLPGTTLDKVREVMQNYPEYKNWFQPEVIESKTDKHEGDHFDVFLRLYKKQGLAVVLNCNYSIDYKALTPTLFEIVSRSTRIAEVKDPKKKKYDQEEPPGSGFGFLWRLNSYWRFEQADNGVYAELEAVSLSRDIPAGLGWLLKGFVEKFPKESVDNTLAGVKRALGIR